jgi:hypothetical protein
MYKCKVVFHPADGNRYKADSVLPRVRNEGRVFARQAA